MRPSERHTEQTIDGMTSYFFLISSVHESTPAAGSSVTLSDMSAMLEDFHRSCAVSLGRNSLCSLKEGCWNIPHEASRERGSSLTISISCPAPAERAGCCFFQWWEQIWHQPVFLNYQSSSHTTWETSSKYYFCSDDDLLLLNTLRHYALKWTWPPQLLFVNVCMRGNDPFPFPKNKFLIRNQRRKLRILAEFYASLCRFFCSRTGYRWGSDQVAWYHHHTNLLFWACGLVLCVFNNVTQTKILNNTGSSST